MSTHYHARSLKKCRLFTACRLFRFIQLSNYRMLFVSMLTAWCLGAAATTFFYRLGRWKGKGIAGSNS